MLSPSISCRFTLEMEGKLLTHDAILQFNKLRDAQNKVKCIETKLD